MRCVLALMGPRLTQAALTAWLLASLCFAFVHALPGDTALRIAAARVGDDRVTAELADRIRREEGSIARSFSNTAHGCAVSRPAISAIRW